MLIWYHFKYRMQKIACDILHERKRLTNKFGKRRMGIYFAFAK